MEDKVTVIVHHKKASEIYWNNVNIPTNREVSLSLTDALRLSRIFNVEIVKVVRKNYDPSLWREKGIFGFTGDADTKSGFGNCSYNLISYSTMCGCDVRWNGRGIEVPELKRFSNTEIIPEMAMVWHEQPNAKWTNTIFEKNIAVVPFETTKIPECWIDKINAFDALFVPCEHNVQMMIDSGIKIPIELIHWGVDEKKFYPLEREEKGGKFTFGTMGALTTRKGTDILVDAFMEAFPIKKYPDVELLCKTSSSMYPFAVRDSRVKVHMLAVDHLDLINNFFKKVDCFVFPTRGEGAGLPVVEALATGLPVIATGWSGILDYMPEEAGWFLNYKLVPAKEFSEKVYGSDCGYWAEPDKNHLIELMRYCYTHRDEAKRRGEIGAQWIKDNRLWKDTIFEFLVALNKHL